MTTTQGAYKVKCPHCGYEWEARTEKPKRCPMCQRWLPPWDQYRNKKKGEG